MERPMVAPAPVVADHAAVFRDLCENHCQFRHVQPSLTGLTRPAPTSAGPVSRAAAWRAPTTPLSPACLQRRPGGRTRCITAGSGVCGSRPHPSGVDAASRW